MIPDQSTLKRFIKARMNFFVYGPRASGKTTLLKEMFKETQIDYIYINCTMGDKKSNFFRYLNHEMDKFFRKKIREESSKALLESYIKPSDPGSVHAWIQNIKNLSADIRAYLHNIYFFIDNIEEIHVSANFMRTFFSACQQNSIDDLKIPFVFCGITLPTKIYAVDKPFRNIISFCMKKPVQLMLQIIKKTVEIQFDRQFLQNESLRKRYPREDVLSAVDLLSNQIFHAFQPMETDLNRIKKMTCVLTRQVCEVMKKEISDDDKMNNKDKEKSKTLQQRMNSKINKGQTKIYTKEMLQSGPIDSFIMLRNTEKQVFSEDAAVQLPLQYYPNLILTSLHLADLAPEREDRRRFQDYKKEKGKPPKGSENRVAKHNLQRIIAISETLESQSDKKAPESLLDHHSLYYYACFEFLREQQKIHLQGKGSSFASTKVFGDTKLQETQTFLKAKMDLMYSDYQLNSS